MRNLTSMARENYEKEPGVLSVKCPTPDFQSTCLVFLRIICPVAKTDQVWSSFFDRYSDVVPVVNTTLLLESMHRMSCLFPANK